MSLHDGRYREIFILMKFCWIVLHIKQYQTTCNSLIKIVSFCIFFILKSTKTNTVYNRVSIKHFIGAIVSTNRGIMSSNVDSVH